ncbi:hypothetical protein C1H46_026287 [Malus baccata]|uniref:Uncharacterized protein n=1 Tax=Malus baccata TaxID=106549 RepID=A0A540LP14_MALBA|nr:hypothetical protein C1H46_026287 [Malus baccata]
MLLLFSSAEIRPLNPSELPVKKQNNPSQLEKRNVTRSSQALAGSARELLNIWLRKQERDAQRTHYNPKQLSPGGPDPRHHYKNQ